jgi:shikimate kinase
MNYISWAKQNKKDLVLKIVGGAKPSINNTAPIAVFAAGIPGAGKTEFLDRLLAGVTNIVRIDMDEIVKMFKGYSPEKYYEFRGAANIIVDEAVIYCRKHQLDFVLDGTFGGGRAVDNVRSALKRHRVTIFYVWKDPAIAWQHTKDRQLVTKRGVDRAGFIESCLNVPNNLREVREKFAKKVSIALIQKDLAGDTFKMTRDIHDIDDILGVSYTKEDLERILK